MRKTLLLAVAWLVLFSVPALAASVRVRMNGTPLRALDMKGEDLRRLRGFQFLSAKPLLIVINVDEAQLSGGGDAAMQIGRAAEAAGLTAFLILIPLAITSTRGWMRRLGQKWRKLHYGIYLAAPIGVIHFIWSVKLDIREPLAFGGLVLALLAMRLPRIRRRSEMIERQDNLVNVPNPAAEFL